MTNLVDVEEELKIRKLIAESWNRVILKDTHKQEKLAKETLWKWPLKIVENHGKNFGSQIVFKTR